MVVAERLDGNTMARAKKPSQDQLAGLFRTIIAGVGGYYVAKGKIDPAELEVIAGSASIVSAGIWSYISKNR